MIVTDTFRYVNHYFCRFPQGRQMQKLREFLQEEMLRQGLSEWQLEKRAKGKITDTYIKDILTGKTKSIGVDKLNILAKALGADSVELFKMASGQVVTTKKQKPEDWTARGLVSVIEKILDSPELTAILKTTLAMNVKERRALLAYLKKK